MGFIIAGVFALLFVLELRRPLRKQAHEPKAWRTARNLSIAAVGGVVMLLAERPVAVRLTAITAARRWGLVPLLPLPPGMAIATGVLLLDYTLYLWHVLTHRVPFLWRFHVVHHVDLDLDASTALRFHFGELALSVPFRAAQIIAFGIDTPTFILWQNLLMLSILFHHSNVRLHPAVERLLSWIIITPRLHGIHHDAVQAHTNSNWSSGLSVWDRLHGTIRTDVDQEKVVAGVPAYRDPAELTAVRCLQMPFQHERDAWAVPPGEHD